MVWKKVILCSDPIKIKIWPFLLDYKSVYSAHKIITSKVDRDLLEKIRRRETIVLFNHNIR